MLHDFLRQSGWKQPSPPPTPVARVAEVSRGGLLLLTPEGEIRVQSRLPAVTGDWVSLSPEYPSTVRPLSILPRRNHLARTAAGGGHDVQLLVANVEVAAVVTPADDPSPARVERFLAAIAPSGATPLVIVTKLDLCGDLSALEDLGAVVIPVCAEDGRGLPAVASWVGPGDTLVLLGASGVGKSTLLNALLGEDRQATQAVREGDGKGRHTTTSRRMLRLPAGGLLVDTPGMRELQLWDADPDAAFGDLLVLSEGCRFRDCRHQGEPGCAIAAAIAAGELDPRRLQSWGKLRKEMAYAERREDPALQRAEKERWKRIHLEARRRVK